MKTLFSTLSIITFLAIAPAYGGHHDHSSMDHTGHTNAKPSSDAKELDADCEDIISVKVDGLVCDFCARALEKVFGKRDDVKGIEVDLDSGNVVVAMKPGQTIDNDTLTQLITDSGYNVRKIEKGC